MVSAMVVEETRSRGVGGQHNSPRESLASVDTLRERRPLSLSMMGSSSSSKPATSEKSLGGGAGAASASCGALDVSGARLKDERRSKMGVCVTVAAMAHGMGDRRVSMDDGSKGGDKGGPAEVGGEGRETGAPFGRVSVRLRKRTGQSACARGSPKAEAGGWRVRGQPTHASAKPRQILRDVCSHFQDTS